MKFVHIIVVLNGVIFKHMFSSLFRNRLISVLWLPYCVGPIYIILTHSDSKSIVYKPYNINIISHKLLVVKYAINYLVKFTG